MILHTRKEYDAMPAKSQGYVAYMESEWPGSELKGATNPYTPHTKLWDEWEQGELMGVLAAQDSEE